MNIVVRAPNWIGDCIMCLPAIRALKAHRPHDDIHVVTRSYLADVFKNIPQIKSIIRIPNRMTLKESFGTARQLRSHGFKQGLLFTNSFRSAFLFRLAGINGLTGYDKDMRGFMLKTKIPYALPENQHHVHFYLKLTELFVKKHGGSQAAEPIPPDPHVGAQQQTHHWQPLPITDAEKDHLRSLQPAQTIDWQKPLIGFSTSAAYGTAKQWLPERFSQLMAQVLATVPGSQILLFGSGAEGEKIASIAANIPGIDATGSRVLNLAGLLTLRESITGIALCGAFVANDSGLMHVAAALQVPVIGLFGPTRPGNTSPVADEKTPISIIHHPTECAPCKHRDCPIDHGCMKAISVEEVLNTIERIYMMNRIKDSRGTRGSGLREENHEDNHEDSHEANREENKGD